MAKTYRCPLCPKTYVIKNALYGHLEEAHQDQLNGLTPAHFYFNMKYNKSGGKCVICRKPTQFNETTERYERFDTEQCKNRYRDEFKAKMKAKYGREHILNDPEQQKKMLASRSISGVYEWSRDPNYKTTYTGSYEKDFLEFMDHVMNWDKPEDVMMPAPQIFRYTDSEGKEHFYVPDVYIGSLNLIIEIKSQDNKHYRERDIEIERIKDDILGGSEYRYLKLYDKDYAPFVNFLLALKKN